MVAVDVHPVNVLLLEIVNQGAQGLPEGILVVEVPHQVVTDQDNQIRLFLLHKLTNAGHALLGDSAHRNMQIGQGHNAELTVIPEVKLNPALKELIQSDLLGGSRRLRLGLGRGGDDLRSLHRGVTVDIRGLRRLAGGQSGHRDEGQNQGRESFLDAHVCILLC